MTALRKILNLLAATALVLVLELGFKAHAAQSASKLAKQTFALFLTSNGPTLQPNDDSSGGSDRSPATPTGNGKSNRHGNNGVGNGVDPQPPGNPPVNDGPGTGPGNPGN